MIPTPKGFKLPTLITMILRPLLTPVVNQTQPDALNHFLFGPPKIVENHIVSLKPELPQYCTTNSHPHFLDPIKLLRDALRKDTLLKNVILET
jgi:hypothetical protein